MLTPDLLLRLSRAREHLGEELESEASLAQVARDAALSPDHFIRRFTAVFGETPHQFRIRRRLETARRMLVLEEASVTEVCMAVGFSSLGSFSWLFTRRFGESPSGYRRRFIASVELPGNLPLVMQPGCLSLMALAWSAAPRFSRSARAG